MGDNLGRARTERNLGHVCLTTKQSHTEKNDSRQITLAKQH